MIRAILREQAIMRKRIRTHHLMVVIAFLCLVFALPFRWLTPQGDLFRKRAERCSTLADLHRVAASEALIKGDLPEVQRQKDLAERLDLQAWAYRRASWRHWKWPELRGERPVRLPYQFPD